MLIKKFFFGILVMKRSRDKNEKQKKDCH